MPPYSSSNNVTTPYHASTESVLEKDTSKSQAPYDDEDDYDTAPAPHVARGPSETVGHRSQTQEKYDQLQKVVSQSQSDQVQDIEYPSGLKLTAITFALCLCVFCVALDNTIIATAIPRITDQFHALNDVGWYGSGMCL